MNLQELNQYIEAHKVALTEAFPEGWLLSGSSYLVVNGYLHRDIHDIDIMTQADHYADYGCRHILGNKFSISTHSSKFKDDDGNLIKCFKMEVDQVDIDIMYNPSSNSDNVLEQVIKYKLRAVKDDQCPLVSRIKHLNDLEELISYCDSNYDTTAFVNPRFRNLASALESYQVYDIINSDACLDLKEKYDQQEKSRRTITPNLHAIDLP